MKLFLEGDDDSGTALVFVYGSLRRQSDYPMARWLALHARYIGSGRLKGRLYHLGQYPGAIVSDRADEWVRGDLYEMRGAHRLLARLDHYEGVEKGRKRLTEYQRVVVAIERDDGEEQQAWVYRYRLSINHFKRLITGDFLRQKRRHTPATITFHWKATFQIEFGQASRSIVKLDSF